MPFITKLLDQKTGEFHVLLLQRKLDEDTILSDGVNVARFRVVREPLYIDTAGDDFALEGRDLAKVLDGK